LFLSELSCGTGERVLAAGRPINNKVALG
jgi:hypothetical protein